MNEKSPADIPEPADAGHPPHDEAPPPVAEIPHAPATEPWPDAAATFHVPPAEPPARTQRVRLLAGVLALVVVVLLVGLIWVVAHPAGDQAALADLHQQVEALTQRLAAVEQKPAPAPPPPPAPVNLAPLDARLKQLEQRPAPPPVDLGPLDARLKQVEQRPVPPPVDLGPLDARLKQVEQRPVPPPVDLGPLDARLTKLEQTPPVDLAPLGARIDAVAGKTDALAASSQTAQTTLAANLKDSSAALAASMAATSTALTGSLQTAQTTLSNQIGVTSEHLQALADRVQSNQAATTARLDTIDKRLTGVEQASGQVAGLSARTAKTDRMRAASAALEAGQPLGDIAGAPPALARYAHAPPPTEAALRLSFPEAARAAGSADAPPQESATFAQRIWSNMSQAVTIRDGDRVLIGGSSAPVLARAQHLLEVGDLAGAVSALDGLSGAPAAAMADWVGQAKNLLDARAALTDLAAHG